MMRGRHRAFPLSWAGTGAGKVRAARRDVRYYAADTFRSANVWDAVFAVDEE